MTIIARRLLSCLTFALLFASLTASPSSAQLSNASTEDAIEAANERFMEAFGEGDAEAIAALYTNDAVLLAPHHEPLKGREAVADYMRGAIEQGLTELDLETTEVMQHGDMAVEVGEYALFAGDRRADQGKYLVVWKHDEDTWMLHRDMMNTSTPQQQPAAQETVATPERLEIAGATASSAWSGGYAATRAFDGSNSSYWSSKRGDAEGAWIELLLREPRTITGIRIFTPNRTSGAPAKTITLEFSDGSRQMVELRGLLEWEDIELEPVTSESVRVIVEDQFAGRGGNGGWVSFYEMDLIGY